MACLERFERPTHALEVIVQRYSGLYTMYKVNEIMDWLILCILLYLYNMKVYIDNCLPVYLLEKYLPS